MPTMTFDSKRIRETVSEESSINELMDLVQEKFAKKDEFFTEVILDGKKVTEKDEITLLETPVGQYGEIAFTLKNSTELAFDALDTCSTHLDTLMTKVKDTAELYREAKIDDANQGFIEITEILNLFIELVTTIHQTLQIEAETELPTGKKLQDLEIHLLSVVKALLPAKEKNDLIMLCDLLEYELIDNLTQWKITAIPALKNLKTI